MKKKMNQASLKADSTLTLTFRFHPAAEFGAADFRESLHGYGPEESSWLPDAGADRDLLTAVIFEHQVPAVIAMAYAEGGRLVGATDEMSVDDDKHSNDPLYLIEVRELPGKRGRPGRRIGFVSGDDFVSDLRDDDEIIDDPLGDVWGSREEAEEIMYSLIDSLGWPTLVDLEVIELVPAGEDE